MEGEVDRRATPVSKTGGTFGSAGQDRRPPPSLWPHLPDVFPGYCYEGIQNDMVRVQQVPVVGKVILVGPGAALKADGS